MPPSREQDLPEYAIRAGDPTFPPPYRVDRAGMDVFVCDGDEKALGRLVERALNAPTAEHYGTGDRLRFEVASRRIGFACIDVQRLTSKPGPGQTIKSLDPLPAVQEVYARQTEVAVMVQIRDQAGLDYWYLPYVLNGLPAAVASGREIYGYPKQHAEFGFDPGAPEPVGGWRVRFGPQRQWQHECTVRAYDLGPPEEDGAAEFALQDVLRFRHGAGTTRSGTATSVAPRPRPEDFAIYAGGSPDDDSTATAAMNGPDLRSTVTAQGPAPEDVGRAFLQRIRSDSPYVFLRQFRDPEREARASYQAMVLGRLVPDGTDNLHVLQWPGTFGLTVPWTYNLAFASELFGVDLPPRSEYHVPVVGMLSGKDVTFGVLRAGVLWQFPSDVHTDRQTDTAVAEWRRESLRAKSSPHSRCVLLVPGTGP